MIKFVFIILAYNMFSPEETAHTVMRYEFPSAEECAEFAGNTMNIHASALASRLKPGQVLQFTCVDEALLDG